MGGNQDAAGIKAHGRKSVTDMETSERKGASYAAGRVRKTLTGYLEWLEI